MRWKYLSRTPRVAWQLLARDRYDFTFDLMPLSSQPLGAKRRGNLLRFGLNLLHRRCNPWAWPIHMQIELANFCNLRCPICPTGGGLLKRPARMMDIELYRRLMQDAGPRLLTVILWAWGESLLHPQFGEFVRVARSHGALPIMSTNGQNLCEPNVQQAILADPPEYLIVAVDGLTQDTYSRFRAGGDLSKLIAGVEAIAAAKKQGGRLLPRLHMRFIVMKHNEHEVPLARDFARRHGFDMLTIRTLSIIDQQDEHQHAQLLPGGNDYQPYQYDSGRRVGRSDFLCQHAFGFPTVFADGTVAPCDQDFNASAPYGRLDQDHSFEQIWFGERAAQIRRTIRDRRCDLSFCRQCPYADRSTNTCSVERFEL